MVIGAEVDALGEERLDGHGRLAPNQRAGTEVLEPDLRAFDRVQQPFLIGDLDAGALGSASNSGRHHQRLNMTRVRQGQ